MMTNMPGANCINSKTNHFVCYRNISSFFSNCWRSDFSVVFISRDHTCNSCASCSKMSIVSVVNLRKNHCKTSFVSDSYYNWKLWIDLAVYKSNVIRRFKVKSLNKYTILTWSVYRGWTKPSLWSRRNELVKISLIHLACIRAIHKLLISLFTISFVTYCYSL